MSLRLNQILGGADIRSPIFYDSNDTNYYIDAASTSLLNATRSVSLVAGSNSAMTGSPGSLAVYSASSPYISFHDGGVARTAYFQEAGGRFYFGDVTYTESEGSFRAPIFYDSNNTAYYIDAASNSVLNTVNASTITSRFVGAITSSGNGDSNQPFQFGADYSGWAQIFSTTWTSGNGWGTFWAGNDNPAYWYFGSINPNEYVFVGAGSVKASIDLDNGQSYFATSLRSPIFYDSDNTGYYLDPASTSNLGTVYAIESYARNWFRNVDSGEGLYNETNTNHFYSDSSTYWNITSPGTAVGLRLRTGGYAGTVRGYIYADTNNHVGFLDQSGNWKLRVVNGDYSLADGSSMRAQLFYDTNDTSYYCDPASTSSFATLSLAGTLQFGGNINWNHGVTAELGRKTLGFNIWQGGKKLNADEDFNSGTNNITVYNNNGGSALTITRTALATAPNSSGQVLRVAYTPGSNGTSPGFGGFFFATQTAANKVFVTRFVANIPSGRSLSFHSNAYGTNSNAYWLTNNAGTGKWEEYVFVVMCGNTGTFSSTNFFAITGGADTAFSWDIASATVFDITNKYETVSRAITADLFVSSPIFYDQNNTAYFIDAASTSNLVGLTVANTITGSVSGNAGTATTLQTARTINGTSFNGSANITTSSWGTARTLTIGSTGKSVDGSANISWSLAELGAAATNQTMFIGTTSVAINRASASQTLTGVSIDGNAATVTNGLTTTNYTSYTLPIGGSWYGANLPGTRWYGLTVNGGEIVFGRDLPNNAQMGILVDGCYIAGENNGFWSLSSSNDWTTRRGMYWDGTYLNFTTNSAISIFTDARSTIFYDSNNTAYYIDPASTSNLNAITAAGNITAAQYYTGGWFRNNSSGNGLYNESTGQHFYSDSANYWNVASSANAQGIRLRTGGHNGTVRGYFYADTNNDVGFLNQDGSWRLRVVGGDYALADGSSMRAQIFYDSNNTSYYTDPASTSYLNYSIFNGLSSADYTRQFAPSGGYFYESGSVTGAIKIRLPANSKTLYPMLSFTCHIYNYGTGTSRTFKIGGHFSSTSWYNPFAYCLSESGSNLNVRWGYEGNYLVVWIGETSSGWSYPCVFITDFQNGYSAINNSWMVGWNISRVTAFDTVTNGPTAAGFFWNQNNDGVGSGLDADLLDGLAMHTGRNNEANKVVRTDSNGYIQAGWINTTSGDNGTTAIDRVYASSDGYIRYYTPANFRTVLDVPTRGGSGASGSWGISITGSSASCTGNAATVTNGVYTNVNNTLTGANYFTSNLGTTSGSLSSPPLQAYASGTNAAFMSFHRGGSYAVNMGLDSDNVLRIGGWSASANRWELDMSGNNWVASSFRSPIYYDSNDTNYYVDAASTSRLNLLRTRNTFGERTTVTSAASTTVDTQYNLTELTMSASITTLTLSNIQASTIVHMWTIVTVGNGTAYSITWPAAVKWPGGTAPTITSTNTKRDIYQFVTYDGGTTIYAIIVGQNL